MDADILKWFDYTARTPTYLYDIARLYSDFADAVVGALEPGPERTEALRKLLESRDAALRAALIPGG